MNSVVIVSIIAILRFFELAKWSELKRMTAWRTPLAPISLLWLAHRRSSGLTTTVNDIDVRTKDGTLEQMHPGTGIRTANRLLNANSMAVLTFRKHRPRSVLIGSAIFGGQ
jgi:hypothetical protein